MDLMALAEEFADAMNSGDLDTVATFLAEDFVFSGPLPEPLDAAGWLGISQILRAAFPDLDYNVKITSVDEDTIYSTNQLTGTHTGDLDLTPLGMGVIPATGKSFTNPVENVVATVSGDKLSSLHVEEVENGGLTGILAGIGVQPPEG